MHQRSRIVSKSIAGSRAKVVAEVGGHPRTLTRRGRCGVGAVEVSCAGKPDGGVARQRFLSPPDGDEGGLRQHGAEQRCEARADELLLIATTGEVLGQTRYTGRVLCTDLCPCLTRSLSTEVVALRTIVSATKSTPDWWPARLAHVGVDKVKSSAKHEVATGLDIKLLTGADPLCVSCVGGKLAQHTFPDKGSDAEEALAVVHIDLCGPFRVAAKDGSLYFLLLKHRHSWFVWVMPVANKSNVLQEFQQLLVLVERQKMKSVLMLRSDRGGDFLGKEFTNFVNGKGIVHDLTCPYNLQQNGMAERKMRMVVESVWMMLLHTGVQHHWWHLALRQAVWVCNRLERPSTPPRTTPYQLLTGKKPDLTLARGWELLDLTDNKVVTLIEVIFYETLSLEVDEPANEDVKEVLPPSPVHAPPTPVADRPTLKPVSATGDEGSLEASPVAPASDIAGGRQDAKLVDKDVKPSMTREQQIGEPVKQEAAAEVQSTGEQQIGQSRGEQSVEGPKLVKQRVDDKDVNKEGELLVREESTDSDVVEVPIETLELQCTEPELRR
ncbi:unnamed protein product [Closterium sp. NIES-54]